MARLSFLLPVFLCIVYVVVAQTHSISLTSPARLSNAFGKGAAFKILNRDRSRLAHAKGKQATRLKNAANRMNAVQRVTNSMFYYVGEVYIGSPAKKYNLMLDTGSANSWIRKGYKTSSTSKRTGDRIDATYGMGYFAGVEYTDSVKLAGLTAKKYSISQATESEGFSDVEGLLSLGPKALSQGSSDKYPSKQFPSFVETLFAQKAIRKPIFSIYFQPTSLESSQNGMITIGDYDKKNGVGPSFTVSKTKNKRCSRYWGADMDFMWGNKVLGRGSGITDTGTTLFLMASNVYSRYLNLLKPYGAVYNDDIGLIAVRSALVARVPTVYVRMGKNKLPIIGDAQFFPESDSVALGGRKGYRYGIVQDSMSDLGDDVDFMLGSKVLERFLTGYDTATGRMSFQNTKYTTQTYAQMGRFMRRSVNATVTDEDDIATILSEE